MRAQDTTTREEPCRQTLLKGRVREGKREELERKLREIVREEKHGLPGLQEGYLESEETDRNAVQLVLIWCGGEPSEEERAAVAALCESFAGILDWVGQERWVMLGMV